MMLQTARLFLFLLSFFSMQVCSETKTHEAVKFAVFPYFSEQQMQDIYLPVAEQLSAKLGVKVVFHTAASHRQFIHELNNESYEIVLVPPFWYPVAVDQKNYLPKLKMSEPFRSLVLVPEDSPIQQIEDLRNQVIATPPKFVPVVTLVIKALAQNGLVPGRDLTLMSNETVEQCFQKVVQSSAVACVAPPFTPDYFEENRQIKFRTVMESEGIPGVALIVHQRVELARRNAIYLFFRDLDQTRHGRELLSKMKTQKFVPIEKGEYDSVRKLLHKSRAYH